MKPSPFSIHCALMLSVLLLAISSVLAQRPPRGGSTISNDNPIVLAVAKGEVEQVKAMLDKEPQLVNHLSTSKSTLLHTAISSRRSGDKTQRKELVALLLERGADPNYSGPNLVYTPLINAVRNSDEEVVTLLLAKKADPDKADLNGVSPLQHALDAGNNTIIVESLIKAGVSMSRWNTRGLYPLHIAAGAAASNKALVELMLAKGADVNVRTRAGTERIRSERSSRGLTPLHLAAERGNAAVMKLLLSKGAVKDARSDAGETPLHRAAQAGSSNVEVLLAAGADANARNTSGDTPLHLVLRSSSRPQAALKALTAKGDLSLRDRFGLTPLLMALVVHDKAARDLLVTGTKADKTTETFDDAAQNDVARLAKLLDERPFLATTALANGWTPLHMAALWGAKDTVRLLLDKGAELDARDAQGATPLHRALPTQNITPQVREVVVLLVKAGADVNAYASTEPNAAPDNSWRSHLVDTPLNRAIVAGDKELVQLLLSKGANINDLTEHYDTPLLVAVKSGRTEIVPLLLAAKADVNARDEVSMTPLTRALSSSNQDLAKLLITAGADVNIGDTNGTTPLMWAAMRGNMEIAKLLIAKKADVTARTRSGESAIGSAKRHGNKELIEFLKQNGVPE